MPTLSLHELGGNLPPMINMFQFWNEGDEDHMLNEEDEET